MRLISCVSARSYHVEVLQHWSSLHVRAVFSGTWHLQHEDGHILSVTTVPYNGPLGVCVALPTLEQFCMQPGTPGQIRNREILIGDVRILLKHAWAWKPRSLGRDRTIGLPKLAEDLSFLESRTSLPSILPSSSTCLPTFTDLDAPHLESYVLSLLGRGIGLTPAGDDVLTGILLGLHVLGQRMGEQRQWAFQVRSSMDRIITQHARARTTALSQTLLHYAGRGVALEPLFNVLCTLGTGECISDLDTLRSVGHSSGCDMLTGVILAGRAMLERGTIHGATLVRSA